MGTSEARKGSDRSPTTRKRQPTLEVSLCLLALVAALLGRQASASSSDIGGSGSITGTGLPRAADRIRNEPASVWVEFIQLALEHKPLNLGQGFPDFAAPAYLVESLHNATRVEPSASGSPDGACCNQSLLLNHQYTRSFGHPRLVRALRRYYRELRNFTKLSDPNSQLLVTVGAYEALFTAIMAFVNPGDETLIIDPAFDAYAPMVAMAGGRSVFVPLRRLNSSTSTGGRDQQQPAANSTGQLGTELYGLDMTEFESRLTNRTRLLVLNTPNNPMGKVYSRRELERIAELCIRHNLLVVADEVYEQFYYAPSEHLSIASLPGMWERTITIGSAGKTFSVTGWKIGWALGPAELVKYLQLVHQTAVYTVATPLQEALSRALEHETAQLVGAASGSGGGGGQPGHLGYWAELRAELLTKRNRMAKVLERARMRPILPQGGYFMLADFSPLAELFPEYRIQTTSPAPSSSIQTNDYRFARWLSRVKRLQGIPGGAFYSEANKLLGSNLIRFCFIKRDQTLDEFERLIERLIGAESRG